MHEAPVAADRLRAKTLVVIVSESQCGIVLSARPLLLNELEIWRQTCAMCECRMLPHGVRICTAMYVSAVQAEARSANGDSECLL